MIEKYQVVGVVLAGGKGSRMNFKDKALLNLGSMPLIEHVIANADSQVGQLVISVNRNPEKFQYLGLPLVADFDQAYAGPLVGICSALKWMSARGAEPGSSYLACFPA
ncbi:MAG TPA: molybdenum cofactor guanylyltransferase MobA, partial [Gammaproteobacteria bacterium]|nr:molybdenum cofactor guanylyltransferase MobA [Gammaproteobacteria bacterium]